MCTRRFIDPGKIQRKSDRQTARSKLLVYRGGAVKQRGRGRGGVGRGGDRGGGGERDRESEGREKEGEG